MNPETSYNFLKVWNGRTYFARVFVRIDSATTNGDVRIASDAGEKNPHIPSEWLRSATVGAKAAVASYEKVHHGSPGVVVTTVMGTEVDTNTNSVEVAAFCATWKALGGDENLLKFQFDNDWTVQAQVD
jgi:hypothetical protein